jgi:hypothetical protein
MIKVNHIDAFYFPCPLALPVLSNSSLPFAGRRFMRSPLHQS